MKYKVRVVADMEFVIESEDDDTINGDASFYVDDNKEEFNWHFDYYEKVKDNG